MLRDIASIIITTEALLIKFLKISLQGSYLLKFSLSRSPTPFSFSRQREYCLRFFSISSQRDALTVDDWDMISAAHYAHAPLGASYYR